MRQILYSFLFIATLAISQVSKAQPLSVKKQFTEQDTLRGSIGAGRSWWDVSSYSINIIPNYSTKTITGWNEIKFDINDAGKKKWMQIDLQQPMEIDSIIFENKKLSTYKRNGNVYFIDFGNFVFTVAETFAKKEKAIPLYSIKIFFHGQPREAINPPWNGGWIWSKDAKGRPWMTVACQGLGASVWYPCKDHQSDEPDNGATISITVPDSLTAVANGRLVEKKNTSSNMTTWTWQVTNPINSYNIVPYIGCYTHWEDSYKSENNKLLTLDYWVLDYNLEKAKKQFDRDVKRMLEAFEYWFGPYPFYEDGFKLVESSHLGMEHQSAIAYGNHYMDGYLGMDLSGSGWGKKWDYIIVHESGHEWFANNITTKDIADMWVHEGFTMYSEVLFIEYHYGKKAADEYLQGIRKKIMNDRPLIGPYGVNKEGSGDMYNKGASLLHTIRQVIDNDALFRKILRGLNKDFYHQTVTTKQVEDYFSKQANKDLSLIFEQYLRTTKIPVLEYKPAGNKISVRWTNCVDGFAMPINFLKDKPFWITPTTSWQQVTLPDNCSIDDLNKNLYIRVKKIE